MISITVETSSMDDPAFQRAAAAYIAAQRKLGHPAIEIV